jgi:hypothetical protein
MTKNEVSYDPRLEGMKRGPADGEWYKAETVFLEERVRSLNNCLESRLGSISGGGDDASPWAGAAYEQLSICQGEAELVLDLLHAPERHDRGLEHVLGQRLLHVNEGALDAVRTRGNKGGCDDACRQVKREQTVLNKLLGEWWHWLNGSN